MVEMSREYSYFFLYLFQPFAHYRNPFTWNHPRTLPLPPRSTVIGMLQRLVGDFYGGKHGEKWKKLEVAIIGNHSSIFNNYTRWYKGKEFWLDEKLNLWTGYREKKAIVNGPPGLRANAEVNFIEELFNVHLLILLREKKSNPSLIDEIRQKLDTKDYPNLYLGRAEDVVFIRAYGDVKSEGVEWEDYYVTSNYGMWIRNRNVLVGMSYLVPLHSEFKIRDKYPENRAELFFNRNKLIREVFWDRLYYIPPDFESKASNVEQISFPSVRRELFTNIFGSPLFRIAKENWLSGGEDE